MHAGYAGALIKAVQASGFPVITAKAQAGFSARMDIAAGGVPKVDMDSNNML